RDFKGRALPGATDWQGRNNERARPGLSSLAFSALMQRVVCASQFFTSAAVSQWLFLDASCGGNATLAELATRFGTRDIAARGLPMAAKTTRASVIPCLLYRHAPKAIEWLCRAFGFEEHLVVPGESDD